MIPLRSLSAMSVLRRDNLQSSQEQHLEDSKPFAQSRLDAIAVFIDTFNKHASRHLETLTAVEKNNLRASHLEIPQILEESPWNKNLDLNDLVDGVRALVDSGSINVCVATFYKRPQYEYDSDKS